MGIKQAINTFHKAFSLLRLLKKKKKKKKQLEQIPAEEDVKKEDNAEQVCSESRRRRASRKITGGRVESGYSSVAAAEALSKRMKELEMMDVNDMDHVLDVEEALHYYSRLTCPAYQHIVDHFFTDMYLEFHEPPQAPTPSMDLNASSMRKLGPASLHSSMRSLGPIKL